MMKISMKLDISNRIKRRIQSLSAHSRGPISRTLKIHKLGRKSEWDGARVGLGQVRGRTSVGLEGRGRMLKKDYRGFRLSFEDRNIWSLCSWVPSWFLVFFPTFNNYFESLILWNLGFELFIFQRFHSSSWNCWKFDFQA